MPWFRVDDNLAFHQKVIAAGNAAMGLWVRAGSVAASQLTDGFITERMAATLGTPAQAKKLVENGLWHRVPGGFAFHEWAERQPTRTEVEAERVAARDRMKAARQRKKGVKSEAEAQVTEERAPEPTENFAGTSPEVRDVFGDPYPSLPNPALPNPPRKESAAKRGTRIPDVFDITEDMQIWAKEHTPDLNLKKATEEFADYWRAVPGAKGVKLDWVATWRNDMRHKQKRLTPPTPVKPRRPQVGHHQRDLPPGHPGDQLSW